MTANGVTDLVQFWMGPDGFGPFLAGSQRIEGRGE